MPCFVNNSSNFSIHQRRKPYPNTSRKSRDIDVSAKERECAAFISQTTYGEKRKKKLRAPHYVGKHRGRNCKRMRYHDDDGKRNSNARNASAGNVVKKNGRRSPSTKLAVENTKVGHTRRRRGGILDVCRRFLSPCSLAGKMSPLIESY